MGNVLMKMICNKRSSLTDLEMQDEEPSLNLVYTNLQTILTKLEYLNSDVSGNSLIIKEKVTGMDADLLNLAVNQGEIDKKMGDILYKITEKEEKLLEMIEKHEFNLNKIENSILKSLINIENTIEDLNKIFNKLQNLKEKHKETTHSTVTPTVTPMVPPMIMSSFNLGNSPTSANSSPKTNNYPPIVKSTVKPSTSDDLNRSLLFDDNIDFFSKYEKDKIRQRKKINFDDELEDSMNFNLI